MKEYDEARIARGGMVREGFNIVKFDAIAEGTEAVIEAVRMAIEVPKLVLSCRSVR